MLIAKLKGTKAPNMLLDGASLPKEYPGPQDSQGSHKIQVDEGRNLRNGEPMDLKPQQSLVSLSLQADSLKDKAFIQVSKNGVEVTL